MSVREPVNRKTLGPAFRSTVSYRLFIQVTRFEKENL